MHFPSKKTAAPSPNAKSGANYEEKDDKPQANVFFQVPRATVLSATVLKLCGLASFPRTDRLQIVKNPPTLGGIWSIIILKRKN